MKIELRKNKSKIRRGDLDTVQLWIMTLIPFAFILVFHYLPIGGLVLAFKNYKYNLGIFGSDWAGLKNFEFLFRSKDFFRIALNTVGFNAMSIIVNLVVNVLFAVLLYCVTNKMAVKCYQTIMMIPKYMSWVIVTYMVYALLSPTNGIVNKVIEMFGAEGIDWYITPKPWWMILLTCSLWHGVGQGSIIYYAALMGINPELFESAKLDGAKRGQIAVHIIIPELTSLMIMLTILSIGGIFGGDFGLFYQVTKNSTALYSTTDILPTYTYRLLRSGGNSMGMSGALGLMNSIVGFILIMTTNGIIKKIDPEMSLF